MALVLLLQEYSHQLKHLLRFALTRELNPYDHLTAEAIVEKTMATEIRLKDLIREVTLSRAFVGTEAPE